MNPTHYRMLLVIIGLLALIALFAAVRTWLSVFTGA